jgi:carbamoyl-phosphate synthase small subunit
MTASGHPIPQHATAALVFADGTVFYGNGVGALGVTVGEICFNTGLTGYQEILTDLSYAGQIVTFTFPHIGNVGTNEHDMEAKNPAAKGLIIRENITSPSNFRATEHFNDWLKAQSLTGICNVDTRAITRMIRKKGPQNVAICYFSNQKELDIDRLKQLTEVHPSMKGMELAAGVSSVNAHQWSTGTWNSVENIFNTSKKPRFHVVAFDYGAKLNILRSLVAVGCKVTVVPARTSAADVIALSPDGVFLSNGPGDPAATGEYALNTLRTLIAKKIPMFGICLGHQLIALALGCQTKKMPQGHRGSNHPVQDLATKRVEITSQNHGFVVCEERLPHDVEISHRSLFDGTVEGIRSKTHPVFTVQYHPEASPGPKDSVHLFERFITLMEQSEKNTKEPADSSSPSKRKKT